MRAFTIARTGSALPPAVRPALGARPMAVPLASFPSSSVSRTGAHFAQQRRFAGTQQEQAAAAVPATPVVKNNNDKNNSVLYGDVREMPPAEVLRRIVADATPSLVDGAWRKPRLSARRIAALRKEFRRNGCAFPELPKPFDWKPPRNPFERKPKGHKHILNKEARQRKIDANMKKMGKWISDEKEKNQLNKLKERKGLLQWYYPPRVRKPFRTPTERLADEHSKRS